MSTDSPRTQSESERSLRTDDLVAKEVLPGLDAARDSEGDLALVLDEAVEIDVRTGQVKPGITPGK